MSGSRFLKTQPVLLTALILLFAVQVSIGMGAEPLKQQPKMQELPAPSLAMAAMQEEEKRVVINIPSRTLWVYSGDRIIRYFPVGVGRVGYMTPLGKFSIIRKVIDPGWENPYLPSGKVRLAPGEDNPLGTRWMGFYQKDGGEYGLHGTDNPASVGRFSSHGCIRLKVQDAEALFEMVEVGTPVEVVYEPVLIRRQGDNIRVVVYADRFRRGMPSLEKVKADIIKQYPDAKVDTEKLKAALQAPTERPVEVGAIMSAAATATHAVPGKTGAERIEPLEKMPTPAAQAQKATAKAEKPTVKSAAVKKTLPVAPETTSIRVKPMPANGTAPKPKQTVQTARPMKESELPLNPRSVFN
jgi:hypothetical protein